MPSTYTSGLRLTNQADGENAATWGQLADNNFEFLDDALTRNETINLTGSSSYTLTANNGADDEARSMMLTLTGTPTSSNSVIIPATEKMYLVRAAHTSVTSGIAVRTNAGTGVTFFTGDTATVYCDGTSVYKIGRTSALDPSQNLSDLADASAARVNLGLGTFASVSAIENHLQVSSGKLGINTSSLVSTIFGNIWPIGSLYMNRTDGTNPGTLMGFGTWASAGMGRVLIGVGLGIDANGVSVLVCAETCGGEYEHTMTTAELVKHHHQFNISELDDGNNMSRIGGDGNGSQQANSTTQTGSSEPFNIQQPWYSVYMWTRTA